MRAKVILFAASGALLILLPAIYVRFAPNTQLAGATAAADNAPDVPPPGQAASPLRLRMAGQTGTPTAPARVAEPSAAGLQDEADGEMARLSDLSTSNDPASLNVILLELKNPDVAIRKAALNAAVQFGSLDAIPALHQEMMWTDDPREKMAFQDAIDFLQLPTADSVMQEMMAAHQAAQAAK